MTLGVAALLAAFVAVAAFVQGTSGLGFALIVAPVAGIIDPTLLPVFLLILMLPLNSYVAWRERSAIDLRGAGWVTVARLAATPGGLALLLVIPKDRLGLLIGGATVLAAVVSLAAPSFRPGRVAYLGAGLVTGLSETATGVGGPPLALVYQHRPPPELRSTIALCFLVGEVASLILIFGTGHAPTTGLVPALLLVPALAVGAGLSLFAHHRVDGAKLRLFVLSFAVVSGLLLMLGV